MAPRPVIVAMVAVVAIAACGGDDGGDGVTGRVVSLRATRVCASVDRGRTSTCLDLPDPTDLAGVEVGQCVEITGAASDEAGRVEVVDEVACAAGDLDD